MNKKIMIGSILAVLMLVAISFSSAAVSNQPNDVEKKKAVSPLFGIRTKDAIGKKLSSLKAKFLEERVFLRFNLLNGVPLFLRPERQNSLDTSTLPSAACGVCVTNFPVLCTLGQKAGLCEDPQQ